MKDLLHSMYRLSFCFIIILAQSCKKDNSPDDLNENTYTVRFSIKGFNAAHSPLASKSSVGKLASGNSTESQNHAEGYLYYWSFNQDSMEPDIRLPLSTPTITYNTGTIPGNFVNSTFTFDTFVGGRAVSITGAREIYFKMPLPNVLSVLRFGFDIGSTDTGPKDFELYYSLDEGETYHDLSPVNQFGNMGAGVKNSFLYELEDLDIDSGSLWIRMVLKAGDREGAGDYGSTGGTMRLDNVYLIGVAESHSGQQMDKLYYHVFHRDKPDVQFSGVLDRADAGSLDLNLPLGSYYVSFIGNKSNADLLLPASTTTWSDLYVSNMFSNFLADIFGHVGQIAVNGATERQIELNRWYSQVKFEFTDAMDLSVVKRIRISQEHEPFSFALFNEDLDASVLDQSAIDQEVDLSVNKQFVFNQFLGVTIAFVPVAYRVEVFDADNTVLRTFVVNSTLKNNMQLVFRGELLKDFTTANNFQVIWNEDWDGAKEEDF